jgi:hypothetical protein
MAPNSPAAATDSAANSSTGGSVDADDADLMGRASCSLPALPARSTPSLLAGALAMVVLGRRRRGR